jgi:hypothetical protein
MPGWEPKLCFSANYEARGMGRFVRRLVLGLACAGALLSWASAEAQAELAPIGVPGDWHMTLNEEFSGNGLNTALWTPGWQHSGVSGPMNKSCVSSANVSQPGNGYLYLELKHQVNTCEGTYNENTGALVESNPGDGVPGHSGFSFTYGYVEWRVWIPGVAPKGVECPKGGCLPDFPALWSMPENHVSEIDTMEGLGSKGQACFHLPYPEHFEQKAPGACMSGGYAGEWHTFGADWEPNGTVTYYYDGKDVGQLSSLYITEPQYLVMDLVNPIDGQPDVVPDTMAIDYVRVWQHPAPGVLDTIGVYRPSNNTFYLSNGFNTEVNTIMEHYGIAGDIPLVGDWTGYGADTIGVYRPSNNTFYLSNSDTSKIENVVQNYGIAGDIPVVGDWTGDGADTIGVYRPSNHTFYLSNQDNTEINTIIQSYGIEGDIPLVGDWTGDGRDTPGVYRPSNNTFYLSNSDTNEFNIIVHGYGIAGDIPLVGDWTDDGVDGIGVYRPSNNTFYLSNGLNTEVNTIVQNYGIGGDIPVVGDWR